VSGSEPQSHLTLLALRRTGPKVVTATMRLTLHRRARQIWTPRLEGAVCSTGIETLGSPGETVVVSAKLPALPADVAHVSLQAPGFASIDRVPLGS
jgi:hypothetical protein